MLVLYSEGPARTERPGTAGHDTQLPAAPQPHSAECPHRTPRGRQRPPKFRHLLQLGRAARPRRPAPTRPSLRPRGRSPKWPASAAPPRPRQTSSLPTCRPPPRSSSGPASAASPTLAPQGAAGPGPRPPTARRGGATRRLPVVAADSRNISTQGAARPAAEASHPRVPSLRPRPDTQSQTCGLSRPGAQLRAGKEAGRPGVRRAAQPPAMHREDREDQAAATVQRRSFARHQRNGGLGGVRGPEEGARQGGRAAAGAPIGPGSRPSAQVPALSRGAPPSLVRRRPEGSDTLPLALSAPSAPPAPRPAPAASPCVPRAHRPLTRAALPRAYAAALLSGGDARQPQGRARGGHPGEEGPVSEEGSPQVCWQETAKPFACSRSFLLPGAGGCGGLGEGSGGPKQLTARASPASRVSGLWRPVCRSWQPPSTQWPPVCAWKALPLR